MRVKQLTIAAVLVLLLALAGNQINTYTKLTHTVVQTKTMRVINQKVCARPDTINLIPDI